MENNDETQFTNVMFFNGICNLTKIDQFGTDIRHNSY